MVDSNQEGGGGYGFNNPVKVGTVRESMQKPIDPEAERRMKSEQDFKDAIDRGSTVNQIQSDAERQRQAKIAALKKPEQSGLGDKLREARQGKAQPTNQ